MANTQNNLKEAFAGESQANQKYRAFANQAEIDGYSNIVILFHTTAEAERIHAEYGREADLRPMGSSRLGMKGVFEKKPRRVRKHGLEATRKFTTE